MDTSPQWLIRVCCIETGNEDKRRCPSRRADRPNRFTTGSLVGKVHRGRNASLGSQGEAPRGTALTSKSIFEKRRFSIFSWALYRVNNNSGQHVRNRRRKRALLRFQVNCSR